MAARLVLIAAVFTMWTAAPAVSLVQWMNESALNQTFSGKTVEGHYVDGASFVETYGGDGRLDYRDDRRQTGGRWSLQAGSFCTIYDADPSGGCYRVQQVGENCYEFYFAARTVEDARDRPRDKPSWTARGWVKDRASSCTDQAGV